MKLFKSIFSLMLVVVMLSCGIVRANESSQKPENPLELQLKLFF